MRALRFRDSFVIHASLVRGLRRLVVDRSSAVFVAVWCALTVAALVPVWHQRMLPMLDTPDHLALARAWHSYGDPSYRIAESYVLRVRLVPYLLFYGLLNVLSYVVTLETANKLVLSAYLILFPLSVLSLARALGRSGWLALGAFALAFNPGWIYGFASYLLGTCFLYFGWAALLRFVDGGRPRAAVALLVCSLLVYFSHVMAWALFGLGCIALLVLSARVWRRALVAAALLVPSLVLAIRAIVQERREHAYMTHGDGFSATWTGPAGSLTEFPKRVLELFPGSLDMWMLALLAATTLALLLVARRRPLPAPGALPRLLTLLGVLAAAYVALPYSIKQPMSWWYVAPRLPALMAPLLLLLPPVELTWRRAGWVAPFVVAAVVLPTALTIRYSDFNRRNLGFMRLVDRLPRAAKTLVLARGLIYGDAESSGDPASSAPVYWHFMSWPMALKGGFSPYLFDQGIPVQPRPGLPYYNVAKTDGIDARTAPEFDWYLVHQFFGDPLADDRRLSAEATIGEWTLYRRIAPMSDEP